MLNLDTIKQRLARVPAPPWGEFCESGDWWIQPADEEGGPREGTGNICGSNASDMDQVVADFIVAAPADIKALLEEVERLRATPPIGARAVCRTCGMPIVFVAHWDHEGVYKPRHAPVPVR